MISSSEAMAAVKKKYPAREVVQIIDYDSDWWIVAAVENKNKMDFDSPYYAVDKDTMEIRSYSPIDDLENFTDAIQNRCTNFS